MTKLADYALAGIQLMDLTTLNDDDTDKKVVNLCEQAHTKVAHTAAICIYPQFIPAAKAKLASENSTVLIATVTNFPHGNADIASAVAETEAAIELGADEVDVVLPYKALINGDTETPFELVKQCKAACADKTLKVILETGEIKQPELIKQASLIAIKAGADFIKTSTGKVAVNATLEAAKAMLEAIAETGNNCGFKAAGGVKTAADVAAYIQLAQQICGDDWVTPENFRFGASSLLNNLLAELDGEQVNGNQEGY